MSVIFHVEKRFNIKGYTMYDILLHEENIIDKKVIYPYDLKYSEKWIHPLIIDIKEKIETEYGLLPKFVGLQHLLSTKFIWLDSPKVTRENEYNGLILIIIGGNRTVSINDNIYKINDGDYLCIGNDTDKIFISVSDKNSILITFFI